MGHETTTTWTCDRCKVKVVLPEREQPTEWTRWQFVGPPLAADEKRTVVGTLCNECGGLAVGFIDKQDERDAERARALSRTLRQSRRISEADDDAVIITLEMAQDLLLLSQRLDQPQYERATRRLREQIALVKGE